MEDDLGGIFTELCSKEAMDHGRKCKECRGLVKGAFLSILQRLVKDEEAQQIFDRVEDHYQKTLRRSSS